jgi:hypothetical protein
MPNEETKKESYIEENNRLRGQVIKLENKLAKLKARKLVAEAKAELEKKKREKAKKDQEKKQESC